MRQYLNITKAIDQFKTIYTKMASLDYTAKSLHDLGEENEVLFREYFEILQKIIVIMLYSAGSNKYKKSNNNENAGSASNYSMFESLVSSGYKMNLCAGGCVENEIIFDLVTHIFIITPIIVNRVNGNAKGAYNYISSCVNHKLVDMCKEMKIWIKNFRLLDKVQNDSGDELEHDEKDKADIENDTLNKFVADAAKDSLVYENVLKLKKHGNRLIAYISSLNEFTEKQLLNQLHTWGYHKTLKLNVIKLYNHYGIDVRFLLNDNEIIFKKNEAAITLQDIYLYRNRFRNDLKASTDRFKRVYCMN